jgi:hypothetical protein
MGAYQCKKCDVPSTYNKKNSNSCRVHTYIDTTKKYLVTAFATIATLHIVTTMEIVAIIINLNY